MDVEAAFDSLPHNTIFEAIERLGVSGHLKCYVRNFLNNREFQVKADGQLSSPRKVETGVPQGSKLSPFLFNLVLSQLPSCIPAELPCEVNISIYADDIALWAHGVPNNRFETRSSLQKAINAVNRRLADLGLSSSPSKSQALFVRGPLSGRRRPPPLCVSGQQVPWLKKLNTLASSSTKSSPGAPLSQLPWPP